MRLHIAGLSCLSLLSSLLFAGLGRTEPGDWDDPSWQTLREAGVHRDGASLVAYLREQCGADADLGRIDALIRQLGSIEFEEREQASTALTAVGPAALSKLRVARNSQDAEVARRAAECLGCIDRGWRPERTLAAVRVLVRRGPVEAVPTLLRFLPYADSEELQDEIWFGLDALVVRQGKIDPSLTEALKDPLPARRAVAACIIGRRGDGEQRAAVRKLLDDAEPEVRLRAAQGLLAARDGAGVPALAALLTDAPTETAWQAEELLRYVAGEESPHAIIGAGAAEDRRACREGWEAWWKERGPKVDLAKLDQTSRRPGLMMLCDGGLAEEATGRVWLMGCDGATRWELRKLSAPTDARLVGDGQVLIAQRGGAAPRKGGSVAAYGFDGKALWQYRGIDDPILCQPLPDGHILIAGRGLQIAEVDTEGKEHFSKDFSVQAFPAANVHPNTRLVTRQPNDTTHTYEWVEVEPGPPADMKIVYPLWFSRYLLSSEGLTALADDGKGVVAERDASLVLAFDTNPMRIWLPWAWKQWMPGVFHVAKLPNGRVLVGGMGRVVEIDGEGRAVWSVSFEDQAQRVRPCLNRVRLGFEAPRAEIKVANSPDEWLQGLASKDPAVRRRCADAIVQAGRWATEASYPSLTPLLKDPDEGVREAAGRTLNQLKPGVPPEVVQRLRDDDPKVREEAFENLYKLWCRPSRMEETVIGLLKDKNPKTRWMAANVLRDTDCQKEKTIAALTAALRDDDDPEVRQMATQSVGTYGKDARSAIPTLLECLNKDPKNRDWIETVLGQIDPLDERVYPVLLEAARKDGDVCAFSGLARCQGRAKEIVPIFMKKLQDGRLDGKPGSLDSHVAGSLLAGLGAFGPEAKAAVPLVAAILRDKSVELSIRYDAARALGDIGAAAREAIPDLEKAEADGAAEAIQKIQDE